MIGCTKNTAFVILADMKRERHKRKEIKRAKKRKHRTKDVEIVDEESEPHKKVKEEPTEDDNTANDSEEKDEESNIWKTANPIVEEKSRDDDFEDFIEQLLL
ncbi:hypothetical protein V9T40_014289 [Parthenolecanium corni]|uniref:Uncharacterized protein n=1 Tax=Parthenolecanium corni TaxID=536013 RepID=A0AAN9THG2_9HEMI